MSSTDKFKKGNDVQKTNLHTLSTQAIIDSGSSYIVMPTRDWNTFTKYLYDDFGVKLHKFGPLKAFNCTPELFDKIPDIVVGIDGHDVTIPRDTYVYIDKG
jgi:hypothetical protein